MAQRLMNKTKNVVLAEDLKMATSFWSRAQGLIGTKSMTDQEALYFPKSNWIHTCFMSMAIDVIYVDKNMVVKKLQKDLKPWKMAAPVFSARHVIEAKSGFINSKNIEVGDTLNVGD